DFAHDFVDYSDRRRTLARAEQFWHRARFRVDPGFHGSGTFADFRDTLPRGHLHASHFLKSIAMAVFEPSKQWPASMSLTRATCTPCPRCGSLTAAGCSRPSGVVARVMSSVVQLDK